MEQVVKKTKICAEAREDSIYDLESELGKQS